MDVVAPTKFTDAGTVEELYALLDSAGMGPGWNKPEPSFWEAPKQVFLPAHWSYALSKPALDAAGKFVSTELAERRNLILINPTPETKYATTRTLVAAYQMVEPGESARSHRHTPNAMRLVLDSEPGAFSIVNGKRIPMLPGDVLLTPSWAWHGHLNESTQRAYWIDFLDVPLVHLLEPMFFEAYHDGIERTDEVDEYSPLRFPWSETRRRLSSPGEVPPNGELLLGPPSLSTIGVYVSRLEAGTERVGRRTTANSIFAVIEGSGTVDVDGTLFEWARGDVFAVPAWREHRLRAHVHSSLLRVTDEPFLARLDWLRQA